MGSRHIDDNALAYCFLPRHNAWRCCIRVICGQDFRERKGRSSARRASGAGLSCSVQDIPSLCDMFCCIIAWRLAVQSFAIDRSPEHRQCSQNLAGGAALVSCWRYSLRDPGSATLLLTSTISGVSCEWTEAHVSKRPSNHLHLITIASKLSIDPADRHCAACLTGVTECRAETVSKRAFQDKSAASIWSTSSPHTTMADPPSYDESISQPIDKYHELDGEMKTAQRFSIREEVALSRSQHVAALVSRLLPPIRERAKSGISKTSMLLIPSDQGDFPFTAVQCSRD